MGRKIQWHTWARLQAMTAGFALIIGGFAGVLFPLVAIGAYSLALGVFLMLFEYPIPGLGNLGFFSTNMWFRTVLYFVLAAPNFFQTPGIVGGSFLFCAACTYFASAKTGEVWRHPRAPPPREERKPKAPEGGAAERPKSLAPGSLGNPNGNSLNPYSSNYNGNGNPYASGPSTRDPYTGPAAVAQRPPKPPMDAGMAGGYGMGGGMGGGYGQPQPPMGMPMQQQQQQQYGGGGYGDQGGYNNNPMARGPPKPPMYGGGGNGPYDNSGYSSPASARSSSNASSIGRNGPPGMPPKPNMAPKPTSPPMSQYGGPGGYPQAPPKPRMTPPQMPQGNPYMMNNYN